MTVHDEGTAGFSLRRWSRRKLEASRATPQSPVPPAAVVPAEPLPTPASTAAVAGDAAAPAASALPPPETLTFDSDFTAYMQPEVGETLKRKALRALFRDPRFNVMDGLDVYIDDYSIPDPISEEMVRGLVQSRHIFNPPQTRINAAGHVEDVPADERVAPAARTASLTGPDVAAPDAAATDPVSPGISVPAATEPAAAVPDHPEPVPRSDR